MRLKFLLFVVVLAATLSAPALAQTQPGRELPQATSGSQVVLFVGNPYTTGSAITFMTASGAVTADISDVNFVDVRVCNRGYVFAVDTLAAAGQPLGSTMLKVHSGTMTLSEVILHLERACAEGRIHTVAAQLGANLMLPPSARADLGAHTFLMASDETGSRRIVAVSKLHAPISAELAGMKVSHIRVQSGITGRVYAVAQLPAAGQPIGSTLVTLNGRTMTLAEADSLFEAGLRGDEIVWFTSGATSDAVIIGYVQPAEVELGRRFEFTGATHAHVWIDGQGRVYVITPPAPETFGSITVCRAGDDCAVGSNLFIEVLPILRLEQ